MWLSVRRSPFEVYWDVHINLTKLLEQLCYSFRNHNLVPPVLVYLAFRLIHIFLKVSMRLNFKPFPNVVVFIPINIPHTEVSLRVFLIL